MSVNILGVVLAAIAQFIVGAVWYMPLFGNLWGKIHGFEKYSKKDQAQMQKDMMPWLGVQFVMGAITAFVLAMFIGLLPDQPAYQIAFLAWVGFFIPTQASAVIFGGTAPKWMATKIAIMAGGSMACLLVATFVLTMVK